MPIKINFTSNFIVLTHAKYVVEKWVNIRLYIRHIYNLLSKIRTSFIFSNIFKTVSSRSMELSCYIDRDMYLIYYQNFM